MKELGLHKLKTIGCPTSGVFSWPRIGTFISTPWTSGVGPCAALYKQQRRKSRLGWRQQTLGKGTSGKWQVIWKVCQNHRWVLDLKCLSISSSPHSASLLWCPPGTFNPEEEGHTSNLLSSLGFLCLPYNLITNPLPVPFRGQGGISLLKQHKKKFLPIAEGLGCGVWLCQTPFSAVSPCRFLAADQGSAVSSSAICSDDGLLRLPWGTGLHLSPSHSPFLPPSTLPQS